MVWVPYICIFGAVVGFETFKHGPRHIPDLETCGNRRTRRSDADDYFYYSDYGMEKSYTIKLPAYKSSLGLFYQLDNSVLVVFPSIELYIRVKSIL